MNLVNLNMMGFSKGEFRVSEYPVNFSFIGGLLEQFLQIHLALVWENLHFMIMF